MSDEDIIYEMTEKYDKDIDDQVNKFHRTVAGTPCGGVFCCSMFTGQPERILPHKTFSSNGGKKSVQDPPVLTVSGLDARFSATVRSVDGYSVDIVLLAVPEMHNSNFSASKKDTEACSITVVLKYA